MARMKYFVENCNEDPSFDIEKCMVSIRKSLENTDPNSEVQRNPMLIVTVIIALKR